MTKRLNLLALKNGGIEGLVAVETWIEKSFDPKLLELIRVRVSQMNGCAHCLHMHRQNQALDHFGLFWCRIPVQNHPHEIRLRVRTDGQSIDAQVRQLKAAGARQVFREVASGAKTKSRPPCARPAWRRRRGHAA
jgi:Carboxymuconolactone decarboxylase family